MIDEIVELKNNAKEQQVKLERLSRLVKSRSEKKSDSKDNSDNKKKNHGRLSADEYKPSKVVSHKHEDMQAGSKCPDCNHGTLQQLKPGKVLRIVGNAPIEAYLHEPERLRCGGCGNIFVAPMPEEFGDEKADASANALVAFFRYAMGIPHYRLAKIQKSMGVPLPVSTQYEMVEMLWTVVVPIFKLLLELAANSSIIYADDTPSKIIEVISNKQALKDAGERVGLYTTAIEAEKDGRIIQLFFTGRKHAGENLGELLKNRNSDNSPPIQMTDGSSRNFKNDAMTIVALCLVHGRRGFIDCEEAFPDESDYVIQRIGTVYKNEKYIKSLNMDDQQRLEYHQKNSLEPMNEIKHFAETSIANKKTEANSSLGVAFKYMLKNWEGLSAFLRIPGAPLDNNAAERLVKKYILYRKNSYFYKNENGAKVGDCLMSIIQTCLTADENPIDYLTTLQKNQKAVAKNPQLWLPWNYRNMTKSVS